MVWGDLESERFESFCYENQIQIHYVHDMTTRIRGYCYYDGNYYNVVLNAKMCPVQIQKTTIHEIIHVMENHFNLTNDVSSIKDSEKQVSTILRSIRLNFV